MDREIATGLSQWLTRPEAERLARELHANWAAEYIGEENHRGGDPTPGGATPAAGWAAVGYFKSSRQFSSRPDKRRLGAFRVLRVLVKVFRVSRVVHHNPYTLNPKS